MKKLFLISIVFGIVISIASCDYDDSNDIDFITPNDSTETGAAPKNIPN
ncbi:hypothetical protein [Maribacter hydrothermalis]|nr:hypothetical protein [Maribacter hydrothermalis]